MTRPLSPLTDLSDDEDGETARLKMQIKERDAEIKKMKRELSKTKAQAVREGASPDASGRVALPEISLCVYILIEVIFSPTLWN